MKKTLKILSVIFCVALVLSGIAIFAALNTPVNAVELTETGSWKTEGSVYTYKGTDYNVSTDSAFTGKYITVDETKWYLVSSADDFAKVSGTTAANFIIAKDFSITTTGNTENRQTLRLATIDGCGHTITVSGSAGLFGNFSGKVTNLEIAGDISAASHTSAFAQWCWGARLLTLQATTQDLLDMFVTTIPTLLHTTVQPTQRYSRTATTTETLPQAMPRDARLALFPRPEKAERPLSSYPAQTTVR